MPALVDGSEAIAHVETRIREGCCSYPITPSTTMAAIYQQAVADGKTELRGTHRRFMERESERSSASAAEGFALAGGIRVTALDTAALAQRHTSRPELEVRMQGVALVGVCLRPAPLAELHVLRGEALFEALRGVLARYFGKRGGRVVEANLAVIREAHEALIDVAATIGLTAGGTAPAASPAPSLPQEVPA